MRKTQMRMCVNRSDVEEELSRNFLNFGLLHVRQLGYFTTYGKFVVKV